ncbi:uncharacterized protein LOC128715140 [Anopheles marshallii]|uniref:uncharacterized protein LOC128715140 n=1 Tax=Anopheles marshallii TaxID=1521116 RepID=UPI00237AB102|nr:uncharacterized protein LOC128715140 [Anopheles marshallii]
MDSQHNRASGKSAKPQEAEDTATSFTVGKPLQLKQSKASQMDDVLSWTRKDRNPVAWSDNSSYLETDDLHDSSRLQITWNGDNNETQSNHSEGSESSGSNSTNNDTQSLLHFKKSLQTDPLKRYKADITTTEAKSSLVYHKRMARQYSAKERTPEQTEMRRRNTEAARVSRAKVKMAEQLMQDEANDLSTVNTAYKQEIASLLTYANELSRRLGMRTVGLKIVERVGRRTSNIA